MARRAKPSAFLMPSFVSKCLQRINIIKRRTRSRNGQDKQIRKDQKTVFDAASFACWHTVAAVLLTRRTMARLQGR
jgi:uncharacterized membrane protein